MLILLSIFWGGSFFFTEIALLDFQPLTLVLLRVSLAAAILVGVVYMKGQRMPGSLKVWLALLIMGALNNAIRFSLTLMMLPAAAIDGRALCGSIKAKI